MSKFTAKPIRPSPSALADAALSVAGQTGSLPTTVEPPAKRQRQSRPPTVVVNFKATVEFARLIADQAERHGGLRRMLARMLADQGLPVPKYDLAPPISRRQYDVIPESR